MNAIEWLTTTSSVIVTGVVGVLIPTERALVSLQEASSLASQIASPIKRLFQKKDAIVKGQPTMAETTTNIGDLFKGAFDFIQKNPWIETEGKDDLKIAFDIISGNNAGLAPDIKQAVQDAPIPEPWKSILMTDEVSGGIAALILNRGKAIRDAAKNPVGSVGGATDVPTDPQAPAA